MLDDRGLVDLIASDSNQWNKDNSYPPFDDGRYLWYQGFAIRSFPNDIDRGVIVVEAIVYALQLIVSWCVDF